MTNTSNYVKMSDPRIISVLNKLKNNFPFFFFNNKKEKYYFLPEIIIKENGRLYSKKNNKEVSLHSIIIAKLKINNVRCLNTLYFENENGKKKSFKKYLIKKYKNDDTFILS